MGTLFSVVYNRFLSKVTDDMYLELTPEDTVKDLQNLLVNSLPGFEFPRKNLMAYTLKVETIQEPDLLPDDFVVGVIWGEIAEEPGNLVDRSYFSAELTEEEVNILAILMMQAWVQRQVTSIENTRMKYSGADFRMTSQANHLSKLLALLNDTKRESLHMQRLYKRRRFSKDGNYESNWSVLREVSALDY